MNINKITLIMVFLILLFSKPIKAIKDGECSHGGGFLSAGVSVLVEPVLLAALRFALLQTAQGRSSQQERSRRISQHGRPAESCLREE